MTHISREYAEALLALAEEEGKTEEYAAALELAEAALREQPGIGPGDVAGRLGLKASHTSKLLGKMEERNLIRRSLCKDDLRCMKFSLTKEGECLLREIEAENLEIPEFVLNLL